MADRLLYVDGGIIRTHLFEEDGDLIAVDEMPKNHIREILDQNKRDREHNSYNPKKHGGSKPFARVPITTHTMWVNEWENGPKMWGIPWSAFIEKKLQEAPAFRL